MKMAQSPELALGERRRRQQRDEGQGDATTSGSGTLAHQSEKQRNDALFIRKGQDSYPKTKKKHKVTYGDVSSSLKPWICFAGKKILVSRSSYRRTFETAVENKGHITTQFGSFHNERGNVTFVVACECVFPVTLHWAFANMNPRAGGSWKLPAKAFWPSGSVAVSEHAVETPLKLSNRKNLWIFELTLPVYVAPRTFDTTTLNSNTSNFQCNFGQQDSSYNSLRLSASKVSLAEHMSSGFSVITAPISASRSVTSQSTYGQHTSSTITSHVIDPVTDSHVALESALEEDEDDEDEFPCFGINTNTSGKRQTMLCALVNRARPLASHRINSHSYYSSLLTTLPIYYEHMMSTFHRKIASRDSNYYCYYYHRVLRAWERACIAFGFLREDTQIDKQTSDTTEEDCNGIYFVLTDTCHAFWVKEHDRDFYIPLRK